MYEVVDLKDVESFTALIKQGVLVVENKEKYEVVENASHTHTFTIHRKWQSVIAFFFSMEEAQKYVDFLNKEIKE